MASGDTGGSWRTGGCPMRNWFGVSALASRPPAAPLSGDRREPDAGTCCSIGGVVYGVPGMAPRPLWKGYLKLALVTCPVALFTAASTAERISFHTYNRETGHRVRRQFIDADTGEVVDEDDQVRGYDLKGQGFVEI